MNQLVDHDHCRRHPDTFRQIQKLLIARLLLGKHAESTTLVFLALGFQISLQVRLQLLREFLVRHYPPSDEPSYHRPLISKRGIQHAVERCKAEFYQKLTTKPPSHYTCISEMADETLRELSLLHLPISAADYPEVATEEWGPDFWPAPVKARQLVLSWLIILSLVGKPPKLPVIQQQCEQIQRDCSRGLIHRLAVRHIYAAKFASKERVLGLDAPQLDGTAPRNSCCLSQGPALTKSEENLHVWTTTAILLLQVFAAQKAPDDKVEASVWGEQMRADIAELLLHCMRAALPTRHRDFMRQLITPVKQFYWGLMVRFHHYPQTLKDFEYWCKLPPTVTKPINPEFSDEVVKHVFKTHLVCEVAERFLKNARDCTTPSAPFIGSEQRAELILCAKSLVHVIFEAPKGLKDMQTKPNIPQLFVMTAKLLDKELKDSLIPIPRRLSDSTTSSKAPHTATNAASSETHTAEPSTRADPEASGQCDASKAVLRDQSDSNSGPIPEPDNRAEDITPERSKQDEAEESAKSSVAAPDTDCLNVGQASDSEKPSEGPDSQANLPEICSPPQSSTCASDRAITSKVMPPDVIDTDKQPQKDTLEEPIKEGNTLLTAPDSQAERRDGELAERTPSDSEMAEESSTRKKKSCSTLPDPQLEKAKSAEEEEGGASGSEEEASQADPSTCLTSTGPATAKDDKVKLQDRQEQPEASSTAASKQTHPLLPQYSAELTVTLWILLNTLANLLMEHRDLMLQHYRRDLPIDSRQLMYGDEGSFLDAADCIRYTPSVIAYIQNAIYLSPKIIVWQYFPFFQQVMGLAYSHSNAERIRQPTTLVNSLKGLFDRVLQENSKAFELAIIAHPAPHLCTKFLLTHFLAVVSYWMDAKGGKLVKMNKMGRSFAKWKKSILPFVQHINSRNGSTDPVTVTTAKTFFKCAEHVLQINDPNLAKNRDAQIALLDCYVTIFKLDPGSHALESTGYLAKVFRALIAVDPEPEDWTDLESPMKEYARMTFNVALDSPNFVHKDASVAGNSDKIHMTQLGQVALAISVALEMSTYKKRLPTEEHTTREVADSDLVALSLAGWNCVTAVRAMLSNHRTPHHNKSKDSLLGFTKNFADFLCEWKRPPAMTLEELRRAHGFMSLCPSAKETRNWRELQELDKELTKRIAERDAPSKEKIAEKASEVARQLLEAEEQAKAKQAKKKAKAQQKQPSSKAPSSQPEESQSQPALSQESSAQIQTPKEASLRGSATLMKTTTPKKAPNPASAPVGPNPELAPAGVNGVSKDQKTSLESMKLSKPLSGTAENSAATSVKLAQNPANASRDDELGRLEARPKTEGVPATSEKVAVVEAVVAGTCNKEGKEEEAASKAPAEAEWQSVSTKRTKAQQSVSKPGKIQAQGRGKRSGKGGGKKGKTSSKADNSSQVSSGLQAQQGALSKSSSSVLADSQGSDIPILPGKEEAQHSNLLLDSSADWPSLPVNPWKMDSTSSTTEAQHANSQCLPAGTKASEGGHHEGVQYKNLPAESRLQLSRPERPSPSRPHSGHRDVLHSPLPKELADIISLTERDGNQEGAANLEMAGVSSLSRLSSGGVSSQPQLLSTPSRPSAAARMQRPAAPTPAFRSPRPAAQDRLEQAGQMPASRLGSQSLEPEPLPLATRVSRNGAGSKLSPRPLAAEASGQEDTAAVHSSLDAFMEELFPGLHGPADAPPERKPFSPVKNAVGPLEDPNKSSLRREMLARASQRLSPELFDILEQSETPLICPITQELMEDPVIAEDGFTYERSAIRTWLQHSFRSPMTNMLLSSPALRPNQVSKDIIAKMLDD